MKRIFVIISMLFLTYIASAQMDSTILKYPLTSKINFRGTMNNQAREIDFWVINGYGKTHYYVNHAFSGATWPKSKIMFTPPVEYIDLMQKQGNEIMLKRNKKRVR